MSEVTIHQVARAAGVSASTVSNLLNGRTSRMLPATRLRVEAAIDQLGYRPNRAARQLRTGRIQMIGLVVPSVGNPFWGALAHELEAAALAKGYHVLLCNSERDPDRERRYIEELFADGIRGVVLCSALPSLDHVTPLLDRGLQLVAFDRPTQADDPPALISISVDNALGAELATRHLLQLGHRRLAFVSGAIRSLNRQERFRGFLAGLRAFELSQDDAVIWPGSTLAEFGDARPAELGRAAARDLLNHPRRPTAVVAINDMCALGVCRGIRDAGLDVPADMSVAGFDDIPLADLYQPPLTTIRQPLTHLAATAFSELATRIENNAPTHGLSLLMRPELVVRDSTAPPTDNTTLSR